MDITVRNLTAGDIPAVVEMLREFAAFEKLLDYCDITEQSLAEAVFGDEGFVHCLVACEGRIPIGFAIYYPSFSSFRGERGFYLEDIFINTEYRGRGVGDDLLRSIAREAISRGYERIDFQVLQWNTPAIGFYEKRGATRNDDERHYKFAGEAFHKLAG